MWRFFVHRPIVAIVVSTLIVLVGAVALTRLPIEQYPDVVPPQVQISAALVGADAETLADTVAAPIEQQMSGVEGMIYVTSTSASDGTMSLRAVFEVGSDPDISAVLTQNRVAQASSRLPEITQRTGITIRTSFAQPLMVLSLYSPNRTFDPSFLSNYAQINLTDRLLRVEGVGQVNVFGGSNYAMRIWLDPAKLARTGLTVPDVMTAIAAQNDAYPAGQLGGPPARPRTPFTYNVIGEGRLETPEQFGAIVLRTDPDGAVLRLRDVARVEMGSESYFQRGRFNGVPAVVLVVYQSPDSNALATADGVRAAMDALAQRFPDDVRYSVSLDSTAAVRAGIEEIALTLVIALVLVAIVVYLFLESARATLIPMLTVPVSLIGACMVFPLVGFSINSLSLFGLVLAIGLVVDDAIVVVEAVQRKIEQGLPPKEATLAAMGEVASPVVAVALILAAVFIPVAFAGGISGRLYQQFALTIAISVLLSAFNALTLSPALSARLLRKSEGTRRGPLGRLFDRFDRGFGRTTNGYERVVRFGIRRLALSLLFLGAFTALAALLGRATRPGYVPAEDQGFAFASFSLPEGASIERTDAALREVEQLLARTPGVDRYTTIVGYNFLAGASAPFFGLAFIGLDPWSERDSAELSAAALSARLSAAAAGIPSLVGVFTPPPAIPGLGTTGGFSLYLQDVSGTQSPAELADQVARFVAAANERPELANVLSPYRASVPQRRAIVDEALALRLGLDLDDVKTTLGALLGGGYVNQFNRFGRTWNVYVQADEDFRVDARDLDLFFVRNAEDAMVPLSAIVRLEASSGPQFVNRFNLYRAALVIGSPAPGRSSGEALAAIREVADEVLPPTMSYELSDLSRQEAEATSIVPVFVLAVVSVFLILAALYESWSLPFAVLLATPIAMAGAFLGLLLRGLEFDVYAQVGLIMLVGLSAKNAVLIVEYARAEVQRGVPVVEAAVDAARIRFRPILMTSLAFILGCLPLWFATGAGSVGRRVLGTVVVAGMTFSTLIAIVVIPALFVAVEKVAGFRPLGAWRRRRGGGAATPAE